jgi:hypothetical protein
MAEAGKEASTVNLQQQYVDKAAEHRAMCEDLERKEKHYKAKERQSRPKTGGQRLRPQLQREAERHTLEAGKELKAALDDQNVFDSEVIAMGEQILESRAFSENVDDLQRFKEIYLSMADDPKFDVSKQLALLESAIKYIEKSKESYLANAEFLKAERVCNFLLIDLYFGGNTAKVGTMLELREKYNLAKQRACAAADAFDTANQELKELMLESNPWTAGIRETILQFITFNQQTQAEICQVMREDSAEKDRQIAALEEENRRLAQRSTDNSKPASDEDSSEGGFEEEDADDTEVEKFEGERAPVAASIDVAKPPVVEQPKPPTNARRARKAKHQAKDKQIRENRIRIALLQNKYGKLIKSTKRGNRVREIKAGDERMVTKYGHMSGESYKKGNGRQVEKLLTISRRMDRGSQPQANITEEEDTAERARDGVAAEELSIDDVPVYVSKGAEKGGKGKK